MGCVLVNFENKKAFIYNFFYFLIWFFILFFAVKFAAVYLLPFLIGVFIAYIVQKPAQVIANKIKVSKNIIAAILSVVIFLVFFALVLLTFWMIYSRFFDKIESFKVKTEWNKIYEKLMLFLSKNPLNNLTKNTSFNNISKDLVGVFIEKITVLLSNNLALWVKRLPSLIVSILITIIATCYISKDFDCLCAFLKGFIDDKIIKKFIEIKNILFECVFKFLIGYFWIFLIVFFETALGLFCLGISNVLMFALLISFIDVLPIFGAGIILLPWSIVEIVGCDFSKGIGLIIVYLIIIVSKNIVEPKIIGKQIDINPLFTLMFIFLGLKIGGVIGMLIFPIVFTVIFTYARQHIKNIQ